MITKYKLFENSHVTFFCIYEHDLNCLKERINSGVDVNLIDQNGNSLLRSAIQGRDIDIINYLIELGANVNYIDPSGQSVMRACLYTNLDNNSIEIIKILLDAGLDLNLAKDNDLVFMSSWDETASVAKKKIQDKIVKMLIDGGADVNFIAQYKGTPRKPTALYNATWSNYIYLVKLLLDAGADPNIKSNEDTPLDEVCRKSKSSTIKKDKKIITINYNEEISAMLIDAGATYKKSRNIWGDLLYSARQYNMIVNAHIIENIGLDLDKRDKDGKNFMEILSDDEKQLLLQRLKDTNSKYYYIFNKYIKIKKFNL
jgi:ankyrin repeat protein